MNTSQPVTSDFQAWWNRSGHDQISDAISTHRTFGYKECVALGFYASQGRADEYLQSLKEQEDPNQFVFDFSR